MVKLTELIKESKQQHYHLLTIIADFEVQKGKINEIVDFLRNKNWKEYNVEQEVLKIIEEIPENKLKTKINSEIKKWIRTTNKNSILLNSNILYNSELGTQGPFATFKYLFRDDKESILFLDGKLRGNDTAYYSTPDRPDYKEIKLDEVVFENIEEIEIA